MPEFAEVFVITEDLQSLVGQCIKSVINKSKYSIPSKKLLNKEIKEIFNRGKYIVLRLDTNLYLTIHLGMTGKLLYHLPVSERKHLKIKLKLTSSELFFCDTRGFGRVILSNEIPKSELIDPREKLYYKNLKTKIVGRATPIFSLLLDQKIAFGVGSYLAQETLFRAGISPLRKQLTEEEAEQIANHLSKVIKLALRLGGATINDYRRLNGERGRMQKEFKVYQRKGLPCYLCAWPIKRAVISGRGAYFCSNCQK